jgi:hypothetical protein
MPIETTDSTTALRDETGQSLTRRWSIPGRYIPLSGWPAQCGRRHLRAAGHTGRTDNALGVPLLDL